MAGYKYLKEIFMNNEENDLNEYYIFIVNKFAIDKKIVERSIRYAIEIGWNRASYKHIEEIFGHSLDLMKNKPTNYEFIAAVLERLRHNMWRYFHFIPELYCVKI